MLIRFYMPVDNIRMMRINNDHLIENYAGQPHMQTAVKPRAFLRGQLSMSSVH